MNPEFWNIIRLFRLQIFVNVNNFLRLFHLIYNPVSVPQEESGQKRQKKCIGSEMSEKTFKKIHLKKFSKIRQLDSKVKDF
jgi:hypothetical protein